jgi:DNA-binding response OmpR family regulator
MNALKILVADDSHTIRTQLKQILSREGFDVVTTATGRDAVDQILAEQPGLAILDINMPVLDGYGVCQELMERGAPWDHLPIVFLTSLNSHALEMLGGKMGGYLRKPIEAEKVVALVRSLLAATSNKQ